VNVIEKYLQCKLKIDPLKSDLKWLDKQMHTIRVSSPSDLKVSVGSKCDKLDKLIESKQVVEKKLAECEAFKEHVDVVLKVLKEKYREDEYRIFEGNYINKQSLRSVADELFCSHMHVKRVSGKIKADFDVLTDILTDCEDIGL